MKGTPDNVQRFNVIALALFERLYEAFPTPIDFPADGIAIEAAPKEADAREIWNYGDCGPNVLTWLTEEGFVRLERSPRYEDTFHNVRLTLKGLTVLGYVPISVTEGGKKSVAIEWIKKALVNGAEKAGVEAAKSIMGALMKASIEFAMSRASQNGISI